MNSVIFNGYIYTKPEYLLDENGINTLQFWVTVDTPTLKGVSLIPCLTKGELAVKCYQEFTKGGYIEVLGEICKPSKMNVYVYAHQVVFQAENKEQLVMRSTEFLTLYRPDGIMEQLAKFKERKRKNK